MTGALWIAFTVAAALGQTLRNAMQHRLIDTVGTVGATHVRFLYGLPFAAVFLALVWASGAIAAPQFSLRFCAWLALGAVTQILATAFLLMLMQRRSFVVSTAYIKTEPVQLAGFGWLFLGEALSAAGTAAVAIATSGVLLLSWPARARTAASGDARSWIEPAALGLLAAALFAVSVVGYRGAILALGDDPFYGRATLALALALALQTALLSGWLRVAEPGRLGELARAWRPSALAGFLGAAASQCWFLAFALASPAAVRTVGLIEVLFAMAVSRRLFAQTTGARELAGIALLVVGVALLLNAEVFAR